LARGYHTLTLKKKIAYYEVLHTALELVGCYEHVNGPPDSIKRGKFM